MITNLRMDRILFGFLKFLSANRGWLMTLVSGFLIGRITNEVSTPKADFESVLQGVFSLAGRPANLLSWLSVILLLGIPLSLQLLKRFHQQKQYVKLFANILQKHRSRSISPFSGLAWDDDLSLQTCPELHRGWIASEVRVQHDTTRFSIPDKYKQAFKDYYEEFREAKRFYDDGTKLMLTRNPASFSDSPTLSLNTRETLYSQVQFYKDNVAILTPERNELIRKAVEGQIEFPHSLCMHMVIVTSDDKVVLTKRSTKVGYYPNTWSVTAEEQLAPQDFDQGQTSLVSRWANRLLSEEFGLNTEDYNDKNLRILSAFLESDILNISLCAHVILDITASELNQRLLILPRPDYEFSEWSFLTHDEVLSELFRPKKTYHPSSGYRMLMALIRRFGEPIIIEKILRQASST
jgi:hypothetical protein